MKRSYNNIVYHVLAKVGDEIKYNESISYYDAKLLSGSVVGNPSVVRSIYLGKMGYGYNPNKNYGPLSNIHDFNDNYDFYKKYIKKNKVSVKVTKIIDECGKICKNLSPELLEYAKKL